jgi:serine/threonine protein kinase
MLTVFNIVSFHSGLHNGFRHVHTMELKEPVLASGNFGDVYVCANINGAVPVLPQAVKILRDDGSGNAQRGFDTIHKLQQQILDSNARRAAARQPSLQSLPALNALPQFSFIGEMDGRQVFGYSATFLNTDDYIPFDQIVGMAPQTEYFERYSALSIDERILLAAEMAEGFQALSEMMFVHADINAPNLLIDIERCHLTIIDYDSGAVMDDKPTTFGKQDLWLAPEINDQLAQQSTTIKIDGLTDRWAVFIGIHYLLFLGHPLFFFNTYISSKSAGIYLQDNRWPHIAPDHPFFDQQKESLYNDYLYDLSDLPKPLQKEFSVSMNEGFSQPGMRTSCEQWVLTLRASLRGPEIAYFTMDQESIVAGMSTRLSWAVSRAHQVFIDNGIGEVDGEGALDLYPAQTLIYTLTARTRHGECASRCVTVRVWPVPVLRSIQVPSCTIDQRVYLRVLPSNPLHIYIPVTLNLGVRVTEPSLENNALSGAEAAWARMPIPFPSLQPRREARLTAVFNQLKSRLIERIGDLV